jgi:hypothetical protein
VEIEYVVEEVMGVLVAARGATSPTPCRIGRRRDVAGTVPNRPEAARVIREGENRDEQRGVNGGNDGGCRGGASLARSCGGCGRRMWPAAARAAGGSGRMARRGRALGGMKRGTRREREREGEDCLWPTNSDEDQKRPSSSDSAMGKWPQNSRRRLRLKL